MKDQLDIFKTAKSEEPSFEEAVTLPKKKKIRKRREAKKAPMLIDAFSSSADDRALHAEDEKTVEVKEKPSPHIYSVGELTDVIKRHLEEGYTDIWLSGEVTDFRGRTSRHFYFSVKDERSKIKAVIFNAQSLAMKFDLTDGMEVVCHGKLNVYPPQGSYSILIDYIEPKGIGALQIAFEQLKKKLEAEGLFSRERKKPIPYLPKKIGVITSPTGAAIRDIVHVLTRRYPNIEILLYPVRVQGEGAAREIADAIGVMNNISGIDVLIVGRGGGSIEDLWAFNEEIVARAIAASKLPIISAVGHEIDFTIADFVADVRAATPSAAAEIALPVKSELAISIAERRSRLSNALKQLVITRFHELRGFSGRLADPRGRLPDLLLRVDSFRERLINIVQAGMGIKQQKLASFADNLNHLSPLGILSKGYAVVQKEDGTAVKSSNSLKIGEEVGMLLHKGKAKAKITKII